MLFTKVMARIYATSRKSSVFLKKIGKSVASRRVCPPPLVELSLRPLPRGSPPIPKKKGISWA